MSKPGMNGLAVNGKLPIGITVDGKVFKDFSIRPATLRDSCAAVDAVGAPLKVIKQPTWYV